MSFYRTYRPQVLEDIDNVRVRDQLVLLLHKKPKDLPHAYLFSGPKGSGKTTSARLIAKLFNCEKLSDTKGPCGTCDQCTSIALGNNLDVLEIDAASNRGIDEIRELRDRIALAPSGALYKIYIIDEVHMLTTEAFNALLKTLEEPPSHAVFVLATTDLHKVPATILSRCMHIPFFSANSDELLRALSRIVKLEKIKIADDALSLLVSHADGSFRDAVKNLEQVSFHKGTISIDVIRKTLSMSDTAIGTKFLDAIKDRKVTDALQIVEQVVINGGDIRIFLSGCLQQLHTMLLSSARGNNDHSFNQEDLKEVIRRFSAAYSEMKQSPIPQLPLELAVVEYCETSRGIDAETSKAAELTRKQDTFSESNPRMIPRDVSRDSVMRREKQQEVSDSSHVSSGLLTLEKLDQHWKDFIEATKPYNHSVAGVLRSSRPKEVEHGIVTIEAFYPFHKEKLSEVKTRESLADVLKKLFGEKVKVDIVLGKK